MEFIMPFNDHCGTAEFKTECKDFKVTEIEKFIPCGEGEHVWLWVEKTNTNTAWVAEEIAKQSGIKLRDISYAGRKDKVAVTRQWFSLYDPKRQSDKVLYKLKDCQILKSSRHKQKLRPGNLLGNHFEITLRNFVGNFELFKQRLDLISDQGFPNYFGPQRFGRNMRNLPKAIKWVQSGAGRLRREQRSLYFSVLRSYLFNLVLIERVKQNSWNRVLPGDLVQLKGSHSVFVVKPDELNSAQERCDKFDVSPTGPLIGAGDMSTEHEALEIEASVLKQHQNIVDFLLKHANSGRRVLRIRPEQLSVVKDKTTITLKFNLPAGSYATVFLQNLIKLEDISLKR